MNVYSVAAGQKSWRWTRRYIIDQSGVTGSTTPFSVVIIISIKYFGPSHTLTVMMAA